MKSISLMLLGLSLLVAIMSCSKENKPANNDDEIIPTIDLSTKQTEFVAAGNNFSLKLWSTIDKNTTGNYIVSPFGIYATISMLLNGVTDDVLDEVCPLLGYKKTDISEVNTYFKSLLKSLVSIDEKVKLSIANMAVLNNNYNIESSFATSLQNYYDAFVNPIDFNNIDNAKKIINEWCNNKTNGEITELPALEKLSNTSVVVLLNALYFKGEWASRFEPVSTTSEKFTDINGVVSMLPTMKQTSKYNAAVNASYKSIALPFGNKAYTMYIVLPEEKKSIDDILKIPGFLTNILGSVVDVELWLPKFEQKYDCEFLNNTLKSMGLSCLLKGDYSRISKALVDGDVEFDQSSRIKVDENGSTASSVTSAIIKIGSTGSETTSQKIVFHADRPFYYLIVEQSTGIVLFAGRYCKAN